jgi:hypothetical protein
MPDGEGQLLPYLSSRFTLEESLAVSRVKLYEFVTMSPPAPSS